jgi:hypothetical protein
MGTSLATGRDDKAQPTDPNRVELAAVLAADTFKRSPKLSRLLLYLCEKYFQGLGDEITEYGIGIDVLGRDSDFDPQQDALVRVDTHHLRKRLREYYTTAGSEHEIHIILPNGSYAPEFAPVRQAPRPVSEKLGKNPAANGHAVETSGPTFESPEPVTMAKVVSPASVADWAEPGETLESPNPSPRVKLRWIAGGMAVLMFLAGWWLVATGRRNAVQTTAASPQGIPVVGTSEVAIRIAAGDRSSDYTDHLGRIWMSDRFFRGGSTFHRGPLQIQRTLDGELFRNGREGEFVYDIPLSPGIYELHLYFAETGVAAESLHGVSMAINSLPTSSVDIAADAGDVNTATVKIFKNISPAKDGMLHLTLMGTGPGFLNALEIVPGIPDAMRPIRLAARDSIYRDHLGQIWMPDESSAGGRKSNITAPVEGTAEPGLYQTYRVGHFNYSIPVVEGSRYTVRLHFVEPWFTQADPGGGIGSRVFNVYCEGTTLLKDFDILKEAGGGKRAIVREFHGIPASPQGKLDLTFEPVVNYALVNAVEAVEEQPAPTLRTARR